MTTNNGIKPSTNWDYCLSTQANDATLDTNCPPYYTRNAEGVILTTNKVWNQKKYLKLVVIWANPDATCPTICYDGVAALVQLELTTGTYKNADVTANSNTFTSPSVKVTWVPKKTQVGTVTTDPSYVAPIFYDIKPVAKYDSDSTVWDTNRTLATSDNFSIVQTNGENLCAESWVYGDTMVACVKITGDLTRDFKTSETTNPPDDLEWKYVKYNMHAMIGETDPTTTTKTFTVQDVLQWADQSVDFNTFNLPEAAITGFSCVRNLILGTALSLLLF